jgi:regulator of protease activity HflC (stomatin/prohibitin superfamily)
LTSAPQDPVMLAVYIFGGLTLLVLLIVTLVSSFFTIHTKEAGIVERMGKFKNVALPGLNWKIPFIDKKVYVEDLAMQLMDVPVQTKTKDDATVTIPVRVQYYVLPDKVKEAYYELDDPAVQIKAHVENVILSHIPKVNLDEAYEQEDKIAERIKTALTDVMGKFGYAIENALVTQIVPAPAVVNAMNEINAARREKVATEARAEANYILKVKEAEAEAKAKEFQGIGIAAQRKAIINGLKESVETFQEATGVNVDEVMSLVLLTQYFDMMKDIGQRSNTILMPNSPSGVSDLMAQIRTVLMTSSIAAANSGLGDTEPVVPTVKKK